MVMKQRMVKTSLMAWMMIVDEGQLPPPLLHLPPLPRCCHCHQCQNLPTSTMMLPMSLLSPLQPPCYCYHYSCHRYCYCQYNHYQFATDAGTTATTTINTIKFSHHCSSCYCNHHYHYYQDCITAVSTTTSPTPITTLPSSQPPAPQLTNATSSSMFLLLLLLFLLQHAVRGVTRR